MNVESNRLTTFSNWPVSAPVDPPRLARGGFFYTGEGTEVQCFSCNGKISQWNYGDQVMWRHRLLEPNCTFVAQPSLSGNVSLSNFPVSIDSTEETGEEGQTESDTAVTRSTPDYGLTEEDEIYRSDALRLLSFIHWEDASVSREALVNAGFYHSGGGRLRCAWCGGELAPYNNLGSLGSPLEIHRMYFPRCDHAATIMASIQTSNLSLSPMRIYDTSSPVPSDNGPQSAGAAHNSRILNAGNTWRALGVVSGGARHPTHASLAVRLASFQCWPADRTQTPLELAKAGFFHTGRDDQVDEVRCFYCDGGLGKWEPGDAPWTEHARWFPSCGYVLLIKGQEFVDSCEPTAPAMQKNVPAESRVVRRNADLPVTEEQVNECLESAVGMGALSAGLDAARVKRAITRRLRTTGMSFTTPEALIDAVLDEQLNEEAWSVSSNSQRFARDILAETLQEFAPRQYGVRRRIAPSGSVVDAGSSQTDSTRTPSPIPDQTQPVLRGPINQNRSNRQNRSAQNSPRRNRSPSQNRPTSENSNMDGIIQDEPNSQITPEHSSSSPVDGVKEDSESEMPIEVKTLSLEEENRQLKESRICKVCMDNEVSVVFLPCGHLVSCATCGAALSACPLCRASVKALVRAYLA